MAKPENPLKEFVAEAEEIIEGLNQNLLAMENTEDKTAVRPDILNAIFRAAHTLKGMSGMVGLKKVSEISHHLEDMLDSLRMGKLLLTPAVMDTLFKGMELLRGLIESANAGKGEEADIMPMLQQIRQVVSGGPISPSPAGTVGIDSTLLKVLTEYETHRLNENIRLKLNLFEFTVRFPLETFDKDLAKLNTKVQSFGEIITTLPSPGMSPEAGIVFKLIIGTKMDLNTLQSQCSQEQLEIRQVNLKSERERSNETLAPTVPEEDKESIRSITPTVRVDIAKLDTLLNVVGELVLNKAVIGQISKEMLQNHGFTTTGVELQKAYQALDRRVGDLQEGLVEIRMIPIGQVFDRLVRVVRKLSRELGKEIDLQITGEETKLDKSMIEEIADPLMHLIRNSLDHGIELKEDRVKAGKPEIGIINLRAIQKGNNVVIEVEDDGVGVDLAKVYKKGLERGLLDKNKEYDQRELINVLFAPGFSTAEEVTEVSGRGVGLDVVAKNISKLSGLVDVETEMGKGTKFSITLPITLVIIKALVVRVGTEIYAIPLNSVSESLMIQSADIRTVEKREVTQLRDQTLALLRIRDAFHLPATEFGEDRLYVIVVGLAEKRIGLVVDAIEGQQEIVIKSLGEFLRETPGIAGATELGNRKTILVLDVAALIEEATKTQFGEKKNTPEAKEKTGQPAVI
ncbi:MAG TPA: chemotaxis protein CheA [Nitrospiria bacterium]|jgi:two-component system chemotaxis sensor kinase CheA|nr:chemotaxis protein CheA [Nitrospiria bacterium]